MKLMITQLLNAAVQNTMAPEIILDKFSGAAAGKSYITITVCAMLLVLVGTIGFCGYLRVKIYNYDGFGNFYYMGSTRFHTGGNLYRVVLPDKIAWEAVTDVYRIRSGRMFLTLHRGEKLIVQNPRNRKNITVCLEKQTECRLC